MNEPTPEDVVKIIKSLMSRPEVDKAFRKIQAEMLIYGEISEERMVQILKEEGVYE